MRALLVPAAGLLLFSSCACPGQKEEEIKAILAEGCFINTDCQAPLVCAFRRCHSACIENRDCPKGQLCIQHDRPNQVCLLEDEVLCDYHSDCPEPLVCGVDGTCRDSCVSSRDCRRGQICERGVCAETDELVEGVLPDRSGGDAGSPCRYDSECTAPHVCRFGACGDQCKTSRDCPGGAACQGGACQLPVAPDSGIPTFPSYGNTCGINSDCVEPLICSNSGRCSFECREARDCASGYCCAAYRCTFGSACVVLLDGGTPPDAGTGDGGVYCQNDLACNDGNFCNGIELCVNSRCQLPLHGICFDNDPCTLDVCDEGNKVCSYPDGGNGDLDNDGHFDKRCSGIGANADDCDDTNAARHPGHPEICDWIDNNCEGHVDESLWKERQGARLILSTGGRYTAIAGPPRLLAVDGGFVALAVSDGPYGTIDAWSFDPAFNVVSGPVPVHASTTAWSYAVNGGMAGKRALRPQLAYNGAQVVAAGVTMSAAGSVCMFQNMTIDAVISRFAPSLSSMPDAGLWRSSTGTVCYNDSEFFRYSVPRFEWLPASNAWAMLYADQFEGSASYSHVYVATMDTSGVIGASRRLLPALLDIQTHANAQYRQPVAIARGSSGVMAAFLAEPGSLIRYAIFDNALNAPLYGPYDLQLSPVTPTHPQHLVFDGQDYWMVLTPVQSTASFSRVYRLSSTGQIRSLGTLMPTTPAQQPPAGIYHGHVSGHEPGFALMGNAGLAATVVRGQLITTHIAPRNGFDGGFVVSDIGIGPTMVSGTAAAAIDPLTLGILWKDGELRRTIMECKP